MYLVAVKGSVFHLNWIFVSKREDVAVVQDSISSGFLNLVFQQILCLKIGLVKRQICGLCLDMDTCKKMACKQLFPMSQIFRKKKELRTSETKGAGLSTKITGSIISLKHLCLTMARKWVITLGIN